MSANYAATTMPKTPDARRRVANPLALAVMADLTTGPKHPYDMARRFKQTGKDRHIKYNHGSLYMVVEQLKKAGFIAKQKAVRDSQRPERTVYALTADGRREVHDWMRELVARPQREYPIFLVALSLLAMLPPKETVDLLGQRVEALAEEVAEIRDTVRSATEQDVPWVFLIEEEYRLATLKTEQRFIKDLMESLGAPDYVRKWNEWNAAMQRKTRSGA
jgi:DNA-binding PadR family transcriptional regulator